MCSERLSHCGPVYRGRTNPSELTRANAVARIDTGFKRSQFVVLLFHRGAHYTLQKMIVKNILAINQK